MRANRERVERESEAVRSADSPAIRPDYRSPTEKLFSILSNMLFHRGACNAVGVGAAGCRMYPIQGSWLGFSAHAIQAFHPSG